MQIDSQNLVSITEANQNFSKIARMVDKNGAAIILKNNKPKYVIVEYQSLVQSAETEVVLSEKATVDDVANSILSRHIQAFEMLGNDSIE